MGKKEKKGEKTKKKGKEDETVEICEKQFDDITISIIRECEKKVYEAEQEMHRFVRMYMDKQRDRTCYPNIQLRYYLRQGKERSDVGYEIKQSGKIGF